jgi:hypothetical protein
VLVDSINRGNMTAVAMFNSVARRTDGNPDIDPGNGFLFRNGYSVLSIGVQWDPPESPERMRAWYPEALENGQRLRGQNFVQWWPNKRTPHQLLSDAGHKPYPAADRLARGRLRTRESVRAHLHRRRRARSRACVSRVPRCRQLPQACIGGRR